MGRQIAPPGYHIIEQGDWISKLAAWYGITKWETIWNHPNNDTLRQTRDDPNILLPGDEVFVPKCQSRSESCSTEKKHQFEAQLPKTSLKLVFHDMDDQPLKNQKYELVIKLESGCEKKYEGATKEDGSMTEKIPQAAADGYVEFPDLEWIVPLALGHLDPLKHDGEPVITGIQARLNNLGYRCGNEDGELGPLTKSALRAFQLEKMKMENPTGEPDNSTLDALKNEYGS